MTGSVISLSTGRPIDARFLPAFASLEAQRRAAVAAESVSALLVVATDLVRIDALLAFADPVLADQVREVLRHAAGVIIPELDAAVAQARRA
ncbi:hypothetical protein [Methylobacterium nodulans]|uniref:Uncharacterized protein n=1 Tax=Methylobacterium nodulans (strain LMG 21967 / CNCM I-2342 / ORS 2060) TaxID=460265 RepID=B8INX4_METNO|nr:hypothetical protein [Methylobacterium nodulans]ACL58490.1 hypothetical protein Mnod_3581 [Methylobacterium nodulans ORS 2060]